MKENNNSLLFFTLFLVCVWLVVDMAVGKNYVSTFLGTIFPFMNNSKSKESKIPDTPEKVKEAQQNAPTSSAIGSQKESTGINSVPYGATR